MLDFDDQIQQDAPNPYIPNYQQTAPLPGAFSDPLSATNEPSFAEAQYTKEPPLKQQEEEAAQKPVETGITRFCKQKFYEEFFKVTEKNVIERVLAAVMPPFNDEFVDLIKPNPDFYGPFWILTTIVFLLGIVGNFANYMLSKFSNSQIFQGYFFKLELVRYAFVFVYAFGVGVPLAMLVIFKFMKCNELSFPELFCLYGYSMSCYVPALLICILPLSFLQWLAMSYAFINSSFFLCLSLKKHVEGDNKKLIIIGGILGLLQLAFYLTSKLVFISLLGVEDAE